MLAYYCEHLFIYLIHPIPPPHSFSPQSYITGVELNSFSLVSDAAYVAQNAGRIARALFEVAVRNGWPLRAARLLTMCKVIDRRVWPTASPLRQVFPGRLKNNKIIGIDDVELFALLMKLFALFSSSCVPSLTYTFIDPQIQLNMLTPEILMKIEEKRLSLDRLRDMTASEIGHMLHHVRIGDKVSKIQREEHWWRLHV